MYKPTVPTENFLSTTIVSALLVCALILPSASRASNPEGLEAIITELSSYTDRSSGAEGNEQAAVYITNYLESLGLAPQTYQFQIPVRQVSGASLSIGNKTVELQPLINNAVTPQAINGPLTGPLYWVNQGNLEDLDGKLIKDAILLMDFNSGRNWLTAASLGARAVIFIDRGVTTANSFFREKEELSPIQFPCYWMEEAEALALFGKLSGDDNGLVRDRVAIRSEIAWKNKTGKNIYSLIEGSHPQLQEELLIIEAFYDSTGYVAGRSPGADEAVSVANLLKLADMFAASPPARSILLVATSGHAQSLHGMRDLIWSMQERTKILRDLRRNLQKSIRQSKKHLACSTPLFSRSPKMRSGTRHWSEPLNMT